MKEKVLRTFLYRSAKPLFVGSIPTRASTLQLVDSSLIRLIPFMLVFRLIHDTAEGEQHSDLSVEAKQVEVVDLIETPLEGSVHLLLGACDRALRYTIIVVIHGRALCGSIGGT